MKDVDRHNDRGSKPSALMLDTRSSCSQDACNRASRDERAEHRCNYHRPHRREMVANYLDVEPPTVAVSSSQSDLVEQGPESARGGIRTRTLREEPRGLSPLRLPVSPPGPSPMVAQLRRRAVLEQHTPGPQDAARSAATSFGAPGRATGLPDLRAAGRASGRERSPGTDPSSAAHAARRKRSARRPPSELATTTASITSDCTAASGRPSRAMATTGGFSPRQRMVRSIPSSDGGDRNTGVTRRPRLLRPTTVRTVSEKRRAVALVSTGGSGGRTTESCGLLMSRSSRPGVTLTSVGSNSRSGSSRCRLRLAVSSCTRGN